MLSAPRNDGEGNDDDNWSIHEGLCGSIVVDLCAQTVFVDCFQGDKGNAGRKERGMGCMKRNRHRRNGMRRNQEQAGGTPVTAWRKGLQTACGILAPMPKSTGIFANDAQAVRIDPVSEQRFSGFAGCCVQCCSYI